MFYFILCALRFVARVSEHVPSQHAMRNRTKSGDVFLPLQKRTNHQARRNMEKPNPFGYTFGSLEVGPAWLFALQRKHLIDATGHGSRVPWVPDPSDGLAPSGKAPGRRKRRRAHRRWFALWPAFTRAACRAKSACRARRGGGMEPWKLRARFTLEPVDLQVTRCIATSKDGDFQPAGHFQWSTRVAQC